MRRAPRRHLEDDKIMLKLYHESQNSTMRTIDLLSVWSSRLLIRRGWYLQPPHAAGTPRV